MDCIDLTGQVAIVTGGRHARMIAQALTAAGAEVALIVETERDAANRNTVMRTVQDVREQRGPITLLVNIMDAVEKPLWQIDPRDWSNSLEATVRSTFTWIKATLPEMAAGGRIINIADMHSFSRLLNTFVAEAQRRKIKMISIDPHSDSVRESVVLLASQ